ncbi:MAG: hypothetical protein AAF799_21720 [Myxococcota bacterium]
MHGWQWMGALIPVALVLGCGSGTGEGADDEAASGDTTMATGSDSSPTVDDDDDDDGGSDATGSMDTGNATSSADETGDTTGGDDSGSTGEEPPEFFHTCGRGGPTGDWFTREVPYPEGTSLYDGTPVTTARYDVFAPPPGDTPLPLVIALHGDNGNPGATKSDWNYLLELEEFILVTPQEPHQEVDGGEADNGWDNYPAQTRGFLFEILFDVAAVYDIDIDRLYATGASAGGWSGGQNFFVMQDVFAAVQLSCGSSNSPAYQLPEDPSCLTPARFEIAPSDFLYSASVNASEFLMEQGNEVVFHETECEGHCCGQQEDYGGAAWDFFSARSYCGTVSPPGCGPIAVLP